MTQSLNELLIQREEITKIINTYNAVAFDIDEKIKKTKEKDLFNKLNSIYGNDILKLNKNKIQILLYNTDFKPYYSYLFNKLEEKSGIGLKTFFNDNHSLPIFTIKIKQSTKYESFLAAFNFIKDKFNKYDLVHVESSYLLNNLDKNLKNKEGLIFYISSKMLSSAHTLEGFNKIYYTSGKFYVYNTYYAFTKKKLETSSIEGLYKFIQENMYY